MNPSSLLWHSLVHRAPCTDRPPSLVGLTPTLRPTDVAVATQPPRQSTCAPAQSCAARARVAPHTPHTAHPLPQLPLSKRYGRPADPPKVHHNIAHLPEWHPPIPGGHRLPTPGLPGIGCALRFQKSPHPHRLDRNARFLRLLCTTNPTAPGPPLQHRPTARTSSSNYP